MAKDQTPFGGGPGNVDPREVLQELWRDLGRARHATGWILLGIVGVSLAVSSYAQVEPDEVGVITRLGRFTNTVEPGRISGFPSASTRSSRCPCSGS